MRFRWLLTLTGTIGLLTGSLYARQDGGKKPADPTALQQKAEAKFRELKATMQRMKKELADREPDKVERIRAGLRYMTEASLDQRMAKISDLLQERSWDEAIREMDGVRRDLENLMRLLLDRDVDLRALLDRIERLEHFRKKVDELLAEQRREKEASSRAEELQRRLRDIARARRKVEELIAGQKGLHEATKKMSPASARSGKAPSDQGKLADEAGALEDEVAEIERAAKEGAGAAGAPQESGGNGGAASGALGKSSDAMRAAAGKLGAGAPEAALDDQEEALDELNKAREELDKLAEETRRKLQEIPFERLSKQQLETMQKTDKLAEEAEEAEKAGEGEDGEGEPIPGRRNIEQAVPKQKSAAGSLKRHKPGPAKNDQKDAEDELAEAKKKLEDALAQLRQELQEEVLKALEERFTAMLTRQKELSRLTAVTDGRRKKVAALTKRGVIPSSVKAACERIAEGEFMLRDEAKDALHLLEEEGSTAVFPEIVAELAGDLDQIGRMVDGYATGATVQGLQKEVEKMLEDLLDALTRTIEYKEGEGGGQCDGEQPLVPLSAELRMLRTLQKAVNKKTKLVNSLKPGSRARKDVAGRTARQQGKVEELTRKLANKLQKEEEEDEGGGDDGGRR